VSPAAWAHFLRGLFEPQRHRPGRGSEIVDLHVRGMVEVEEESVEYLLPHLSLAIDAGPHPDIRVWPGGRLDPGF
jgi:hypothetical protein